MYFKCNWNIEKLKIKNGFQTIVCDPFFVTVSSTSLYESIIFYLLYAFQVQLVISSRFFTFALLLALKKLLLATKQLFLCFFKVQGSRLYLAIFQTFILWRVLQIVMWLFILVIYSTLKKEASRRIIKEARTTVKTSTSTERPHQGDLTLPVDISCLCDWSSFSISIKSSLKTDCSMLTSTLTRFAYH